MIKTTLKSVCILLLVFSGQLDAGVPEYMKWHTVTLSFEGPESSENSSPNPFTDYRLMVRFWQDEHEIFVRGFYAADGNAAQSGADSGNTWQVRFTPDRIGAWFYEATFSKGEMVALSNDPAAGEPLPLSAGSGSFIVKPSDKQANDFRARGRLQIKDQYFRFQGSDEFWIKGGADSPENLLGFAGFDGTWRFGIDVRAGESTATGPLHHFEPHLKDWKNGDPVWRGGEGKGLVGALNYLASRGMNAVYFLTMNIGGDGKDVWPYTDYAERYRFDVSKLDQWEIVFQHMQKLGILMHVVTQETENETLLDGGDTGPQRQLYYRELIARFAHHPALVWNLGEENGPAEFTPVGQTAKQQKAMAAFFDANDPYGNPVLLHTHSWEEQKDLILTPLLGFKQLDGLSFQVNNPDRVNDELIRWREKSTASGHPWIITMDEIGPWDVGTVPDSVDPGHDELRGKVLWGSLFGGAAGIEWYFGANYPGNDLGVEDWRSREAIWDQTRHALDFMQAYLPFERMAPSNDLCEGKGTYCFAEPGSIYTVYLPQKSKVTVNLESHSGNYSIEWFDPKSGGPLQKGSVGQLSGPGIQNIGAPPGDGKGDWVVLIRRMP